MADITDSGEIIFYQSYPLGYREQRNNSPKQNLAYVFKGISDRDHPGRTTHHATDNCKNHSHLERQIFIGYLVS